MNEKELNELTDKVNQGIATEEELYLFTAYLNQITSGENMWDDLRLGAASAVKDELLQRIESKIEPQKTRKLISWPRIAAAASILLCLSAGAYFFTHKQTTQQTAQIQQNDIVPGSNKAILTLAGGQRIILTGARNGKLAQQGNAVIHKTADGQVRYDATATASDKMEYNTMTTPRGGQYHLTLADGTGVWLNAASSIKYPTVFSGKDRHVEITGEAYLEVAHNAAKPFRVASNGQTVEVLGTHFNVNAYTDEPVMKTTLLEGSIKITIGEQTRLIKPGQQAIISSTLSHGVATGMSLIRVNNVDTEEAVAWKNGYFLFNNESLETIMRKVSRWYDVDINYTSIQSKNEVYWGSITRYSNVSKVLHMLEVPGHQHFKVDGNKITVTPK